MLKLGNFNWLEGRRASESAHGDILSVEFSECDSTHVK